MVMDNAYLLFLSGALLTTVSIFNLVATVLRASKVAQDCPQEEEPS